MLEKFLVPIYLPRWLHRTAVTVKRAIYPPRPLVSEQPGPNIRGERDVEWSFISEEMPRGSGEALEFGCEFGYLSFIAARKGYHVTALDLEPQDFLWNHPNVHFLQGDILKAALPQKFFDVIINCSSVEHVGVPGRYGITEAHADADIEVMRRFADLLKPEGLLLMTAPCGRDAILAPWCRVYGQDRLSKLFAPFRVEKDAYWIKNGRNQWTSCDMREALAFEPVLHPTDPQRCAYALGCFVLRLVASMEHPQGSI